MYLRQKASHIAVTPQPLVSVASRHRAITANGPSVLGKTATTWWWSWPYSKQTDAFIRQRPPDKLAEKSTRGGRTANSDPCS